MGIIDHIRQRQVHKFGMAYADPPPAEIDLPPQQEPEMLYIGCIEARLDPIKHIGIPEGGSTIHRVMGALVSGLDKQGRARSLAEAADVEHAIKIKKVKDIVISAHTCCGGLNACLHGPDPDMPYINEYLSSLNDLRSQVMAKHHDHDAQAHALEEETVRQSINNLMTYPCVRQAVERGEVRIHGWVLDIKTKQISEMDPETGSFESMATKYKRTVVHGRADNSTGSRAR